MIVLDTSFLIGFHNRTDVHHAPAAQAMERLLEGKWGQPLLPEYVVLEVATVLLARRGLPTALSVVTTLLQARELEFVPCSEFFLDALDEFKDQGEIGLSFTDAAIVAIAKRAGARVATFDSGFRKVAGVAVVP